MNSWKMPLGGLLVNHKKYAIGITVWALCTYFIVLSINHFYGKHMILITFAVAGIGWFIAILWMLLSSNKILKQTEKPRPKFDNPIHEALYDALNDIGKKNKDSSEQPSRHGVEQ